MDSMVDDGGTWTRATGRRRRGDATTVALLALEGGLLLLVLWFGARLLVGVSHPAVVGARTNSDLARPDEAMWFGLVLVGLATLFLVVLVVGSHRDEPRSRGRAALLVGLVVLALALRTGLDRPTERCSYDVYGDRTTCVEGAAATKVDLATMVGPGVVTVALLGWTPRRRSDRRLVPDGPATASG